MGEFARVALTTRTAGRAGRCSWPIGPRAMASSFVKDLPEVLPEGYAAVPLGPDQCVAPLRLCVLVKEQADPVAGHLVVLRDTADARVLLGGVVDAGGQVHQWVEL